MCVTVHQGFEFDSFEDHEFWEGVDPRAFETSGIQCREMNVTVHP